MDINGAISKTLSSRNKNYYADLVSKAEVVEKEVVLKHELNGLDISLTNKIQVPETNDNKNFNNKIDRLNNNFEKLIKKLEDIEKKETIYNAITDFEQRYNQISKRIESLIEKFGNTNTKDLYDNISDLNLKFNKLVELLNINEKISTFDSKVQLLSNKIENIIDEN